MTQGGLVPVFSGSDVVLLVTGGRDDAESFLLSCEKRVQSRFRRYLERLRDGHLLQSPEFIRHLETVDAGSCKGAQVFELKVHEGPGWRLYIIRFGDKWYVTHGRKKPKDKLVAQEVAKSIAIFASV